MPYYCCPTHSLFESCYARRPTLLVSLFPFSFDTIFGSHWFSGFWNFAWEIIYLWSGNVRNIPIVDSKPTRTNQLFNRRTATNKGDEDRTMEDSTRRPKTERSGDGRRKKKRKKERESARLLFSSPTVSLACLAAVATSQNPGRCQIAD